MKYDNEKQKQPVASNFISHLEKCSRVLFAKKGVTYKAAKEGV